MNLFYLLGKCSGMSTLTLYRVKRDRAPNRYWVDETYRIHTDKPLHVPEGFQLHGVGIDVQYKHWFIDEVYPLIEQHMGDVMVDSWAMCPLDNEIGHVTVAMCVNDVLINADMLLNTVSIRDSPLIEKHRASLIMDAIQAREPSRKFAPLIFSPEWELHQYLKFVTYHYQ